jgi:integrase
VSVLRLPRFNGERPARSGARRVLPAAQLRRLLAGYTSTRAEVMVQMSAQAGLRVGEVIGPRWGNIDLAACRVTVARAIWQEPGRDGAPPTHHVKAPKSGSTKVVAVSPALARRLGDLYAEDVVEAGAAADGYVFPGRGGKPLDKHAPGLMLRRACLRAGLTDAAGWPPVSWHGLRHTAASLMLAGGVPLPHVAAPLRHADPAITAKVYLHSVGEDRQHLAEAVSDGLETTRTTREITWEGYQRRV